MTAFYIGMTLIIVGGFFAIAWMDKEERGRWPWE